MSDAKLLDGIGEYQYGFQDPETFVYKSEKGLSREVVQRISEIKGEPQWMLDFRFESVGPLLEAPDARIGS